MADFSNIIEEINTNLPDNNNQSITAAKLRTTLIDLTNQIDSEQDDFESSVQSSLDGIVTDSLTSTSTTSALSANQGNNLASTRTEIIFYGNDSTMVVPPRIPIKAGHTYRLSISNTSLTIENTGMSASNSKLWVAANSVRTGGTNTMIFNVTANVVLQSEYEFIVPILSQDPQYQWLSVQMKFDAGQETVVTIEDITEILSLENTVNELLGEQLDVYSSGTSHSVRYLFERSKYYVNCVNTNQDSPYVESSSSSNSIYCIIDVSGYKYIRFNSPLYKSNNTSTPAGWAFYTAENYTGASNNHGGYSTTNLGYISGAFDKFGKNTTDTFGQKELILEIPENAKYFKTCISLSNGAMLSTDFYCYLYSVSSIDNKIDIAKEEILEATAKIENDTVVNRNISCTDIVFSSSPKLLLTGASFAYCGYTNFNPETSNNARNAWFEMACSNMNVAYVNKAENGSSITDAANMAYNGTLWNKTNSSATNYIDSFDALVIMHCLNYNVMNSTLFKDTVAEYEADPYSEELLFYVDPSTSHSDRTSATIARSFDYLIKKYIQDCLDRKTASGSIYEGKPYGKPAQIILCTSWHDGRVLYNDSVRKLAANWGFPLVQFDANIGFTKNKPLPSGSQVSRIYGHCAYVSSDTQTIDGVVYAWHPMFWQDLAYNYTQMKMAKIFENSFN